MEHLWEQWLDQALEKLEAMKLLKVITPISVPVKATTPNMEPEVNAVASYELETFDSLQPWDRSSVEVEIDEASYQRWLHGSSYRDKAAYDKNNVDKKLEECGGQKRKLLLCSGNDYLGLASHPAVRKAAAKAALQHGMGPRGSTLVCGQTNYHCQLEASLADLYKKEDCLLCPTGFAANEALMLAVGSISLALAAGKRPTEDEKVAFFSDFYNHCSIIDGIRLAERYGHGKMFVYRHCDMAHLDTLLSSCPMKKKVVVTDSLFSMEGDFAPMLEIAKLRKKHGFLWVVDEAHATLVCGENGGGAPELFGCENDVDICVGMLSKSIGCHGGFIAFSKKWKELLVIKGHTILYSTTIPVPVAAAAHAAVAVARKEKWRRAAIWSRVREFSELTQKSLPSYIISFVVGNEDMAVAASRHMLKFGFHVVEIRPPAVPPNLCRLRISLNANHSFDDMKKLAAVISQLVNSSKSNHNNDSIGASKL